MTNKKCSYISSSNIQCDEPVDENLCVEIRSYIADANSNEYAFQSVELQKDHLYVCHSEHQQTNRLIRNSVTTTKYNILYNRQS